jgi:predicted DNA-binding transcriptional regulator AlpA
MTISDLALRIDAGFEMILKALQLNHDAVLDIEGVCELTGLSKSAIYQKTCSLGGRPPELPHFRKGKRLYFLQSEINTWLTSQPVRTRQQLTAAAANLDTTQAGRNRATRL